jgi:hypothetical protein
MKIEFTYNQKNTDLVTDMLQSRLVNSIREAIIDTLKSFEEIYNYDGEMIFDIEKNYNYIKLESKNLPEKLVSEIELAIKPILN